MLNSYKTLYRPFSLGERQTGAISKCTVLSCTLYCVLWEIGEVLTNLCEGGLPVSVRCLPPPPPHPPPASKLSALRP
jgi:hypothetical protein